MHQRLEADALKLRLDRLDVCGWRVSRADYTPPLAHALVGKGFVHRTVLRQLAQQRERRKPRKPGGLGKRERVLRCAVEVHCMRCRFALVLGVARRIDAVSPRLRQGR